jgi:uncharacterized membrane protein
MQHTLIIEAILMLLGASGFSLASYIDHCKAKKAPLVCPMRGSCDFVTTSGYSRFLGIHIERIGMAYYLCVFAFHAFVLTDPTVLFSGAVLVALIVSGLSVLFSLYLIAIQAFVLKHWCTWCVGSAFISLAIFVLTLLAF